MESFDVKLKSSSQTSLVVDKDSRSTVFSTVYDRLKSFIPNLSTVSNAPTTSLAKDEARQDLAGQSEASSSASNLSVRSLVSPIWSVGLMGAELQHGKHSRSDSLDSVTIKDSSSQPNNSKKKSFPSIIAIGYSDAFVARLKGLPVEDEDSQRHSVTVSNQKSKEKEGKVGNKNLNDTLSVIQSIVRKIRGVYNQQQSEDETFWVRDEISRECYQCKQPFTTFRRRHHCRICGNFWTCFQGYVILLGQVFCSKCASTLLSGEAFGLKQPLRVCDYCHRITDELGNNSSDFAELKYTDITHRSGDSLTQLRLLLNTSPALFSKKFWKSSSTLSHDEPPEKFIPDSNELPFRARMDSEDEWDVDKSFAETDPLQDLSSADEASNTVYSSITNTPKRKSTGGSRYSARALRSQLSMSIESGDSNSNLFKSQLAATDTENLDSLTSNQKDLIDPFIELNLEAMEFVRKFVRQILSELDLDAEVWGQVIIKLALRIIQMSVPKIENGDNMNPLKYVKMKKIPGMLPIDSVCSDSVAFTGNVMHKKMSRSISNPKILLLNFALEYYRTQDQFISLGPVLSQEEEYTKNIVNKILGLNPSIVFVSKTVSRKALDYFLAAGVVVVANVKLSVLKFISRCTHADIISSMDRITVRNDAKLGKCERFYIKSFLSTLITNGKKTLLFLDGVAKERGCTVVLRGSILPELSCLKKILYLATIALWNLKSELFLWKDSGVILASRSKENEDVTSGACRKFIELYTNAQLSISFNVEFTPPFVIQRMAAFEAILLKESEEQLRLLRQFAAELPLGKEKKSLLSYALPIGINPIINSGLSYLIDYADIPASPFNHQDIFLLYYKTHAFSPLPCDPPTIIKIPYYEDGDMTFLQYLRDFCFDSQSSCSVETCKRPMSLHTRSYLHGSSKFSFIQEDFPCPIIGLENEILFWSYCRKCTAVASVVPLSEIAGRLSMGKFLELCFYQISAVSKIESCSHSVMMDHVRYFGHNNVSLRIEWDEIQLFEVLVPLSTKFSDSKAKKRLEKSKTAEYQVIMNDIGAFYDSVRNRIQTIPSDNISPDKLQDFTAEINSFFLRIKEEKVELEGLLRKKFDSSKPDDFLSLNSALRELFQRCCSWDRDFAAFIKTYLIAATVADTKSLRKTRQAQLDNSPSRGIEFIVERLSSDEPPINLVTTTDLDKWTLGNETTIDESSLIFPQFEDIHTIIDTKNEDTNASAEIHMRKPKSTGDLIRTNNSKPNLSDIMMSISDDEADERGLTHKSDFQGLAISQRKETTELAASLRSTNQPLTSSVPLKDASHLFDELGERNSLMKTLRDFWSQTASLTAAQKMSSLLGGEYSALFELSGLKLLNYPFSQSHHFIHDSDVIVREEEPSTLIAFVMNSKHYREEISRLRRQNEDIDRLVKAPLLAAPTHDEETFEKASHKESKPSTEFSEDPETPTFISDRFPKKPLDDVEMALLKSEGTHIRYEFSSGKTRFFCRVYFAEQFDAIRRFCKVDDTFVQSLSKCMDWHSSGGQSRSFFFKTIDDRFIIKQLSKHEMEAFMRFAPSYFEYLAQSLFHDLPSVLVKLFGVFRTGFRAENGRGLKIDVVVMENLFFNRTPKKIFDLKGSVRNRHIRSTGRTNEVLLDENFLEVIGESPLYVREHSKKLLRASVWNDTLFLAKLDVMDYSLLVGIDEDNQELIVGIVDFIRTFTWDKKLESWVKESGLLGGAGKEPTIISPKQYKTRFRESMEKYFLMVPDKFFDPKSVSGPIKTLRHVKT